MIAGVHIDEIKKYYKICKDGKIVNRKTNNILKGWDNGKKLCVQITIPGRKIKVDPKHLVAHAHLPNPNRLKEVIYVDGNYKNNHVDNLLWKRSTRSKKIDYHKRQKALHLFLTGNYSLDEISDQLNVSKFIVGKIITLELQKKNSKLAALIISCQEGSECRPNSPFSPLHNVGIYEFN